MADIDGILKIEAASFRQPWGRQAILDELHVQDAIRFVARPQMALPGEAAVIGYLFARMLTDVLHLMKIAVDPQWRNRGTATVMLAAVQAQARRRGAVMAVLEVRPTNTAAIAFYRKAGFQSIGTRPNYYPITGESALVMSKRFKEES